MGIRIKNQYFSENKYIHDLAKQNVLYNDDDFLTLSEKGLGDTYNATLIKSKGIQSDSFDRKQYDTYLDAEDRMTYIYNEYLQDQTETAVDSETGEEYNVYERTREYLDYRFDEDALTKQYESMEWYEKIATSAFGVVGQVLTDIGSIGEDFLDAVSGVVELGARIVGDNETADKIRAFAAEDTTGARAMQESFRQYTKAYTIWDKNAVAKGVMDVVSGITKMVPMLTLSGPVGSTIYYATGAGSTYNDIIQANPDIDAASLFSYVALSTGLEVATEKISEIFGGTVVDAIIKGTGKAAGESGLGALAKMGLDSLTEGAEEMVAEFFGGILNHALIDPSAAPVSIEDILYAGLIGGITGGVLTGANIASTPRLAVSSDGEIDFATSLQAENKKIDKKLGAIKSYDIMGMLNSIDSTKATNLAKLKAAYDSQIPDGVDADTWLRTNKHEDYVYARGKDITIHNQKAAIATKLAGIMENIGAKKFSDAVSLLSTVEQSSKEKQDNYQKAKAYITLKTGKAAVYQQYQKEFEAANPGATVVIDMNPSDEFKTIANVVAEKYGVALIAGDIGHKDGNDVKPITVTKNAIIIDSKLVGKLSYQQLLETVIKRKLTEALLNDQTVLNEKALKSILQDIMPFDIDVSKPLPKDIKETLTQKLLFDEIAVEEVFLTNKPVFRRMVTWFQRKLGLNKKERATKAGKVEYRELLLARERYLNAVVRNIGNESDAQDAKKLFVMSDEEYVSKIRGRYMTTANNKQMALMKINMTPETRNKYKAIDELLHARKGYDLVTKIDWKEAGSNPEYFTREFQQKVRRKYGVNEAPTWESALWSYLFEEYKMVVDFKTGTTYKAVQLSNKVKKDVIETLEWVIKDGGLSEALSGFEYMKEIFTAGAIKELSGVDLSTIRIHFLKDMSMRGQTQISPSGTHIDCYVKIQNSVEATLHSLQHEVIHALCQLNGLPKGSSLSSVKRALLGARPSMVRYIAERILGPENAKALAPDEDTITDELVTETAYAVYLATPGEMLAEGNIKEVFTTEDWFEIKEEGSFRVYHGHGKFQGVNFFGQIDTKADMANAPSAATVGIERIKAKWATEDDFRKATGADKEIAKAIYRNKWSEAAYLRVALNPEVNTNVRRAMIAAAYRNNKVLRTETALTRATTKNESIGTSPMVAAIALHKAKASLKSGDFSWMFNNAAMASFSTFAKEELVETKDKKTYNISTELIKQRNIEKEKMIAAVKENATIINSIKQNSTEEEIVDAFSKLSKKDARILSYPVDMLLYEAFSNKASHKKENSLFDVQKYLLENDFDYSSSSTQTAFDDFYEGLADWSKNDVGGSIEHEGKDGESDGVETYEYFAGLQQEDELLREQHKVEEKPVDKELESIKTAVNLTETAAENYRDWLTAPSGEQNAERKEKILEIENAIPSIKKILNNPEIKIGNAARKAMEDLVSGKVLVTAIDEAIAELNAMPTDTADQDGEVLDKLGLLGNKYKENKEKWSTRYGKEFVNGELKAHFPIQKTTLRTHGLTAKEEIQYIQESIKKGEYVSRSGTGRVSNMKSEYLDKKTEASKNKAEEAKEKEAVRTQLHGIELIKMRSERLEQLRYTESDLKKAEIELAAAQNREAPANRIENLKAVVHEIKTAPEQREKLLDTTIKTILHESGLEYTTNMSDAKEIVKREYGIETKTIKEDKEYLFTKDGYEYSVTVLSNPNMVREDLGRMVYSLVTGKSIKGGSLTKKSTAPATKEQVEKKTEDLRDAKKSVTDLKKELDEVKKKLATYTPEKRKQTILDGAAKILGVAPNEIDRADLITYGKEAAEAFDVAKQELSHRIKELETLIDEKSPKKTETQVKEEKQSTTQTKTEEKSVVSSKPKETPIVTNDTIAAYEEQLAKEEKLHNKRVADLEAAKKELAKQEDKLAKINDKAEQKKRYDKLEAEEIASRKEKSSDTVITITAEDTKNLATKLASQILEETTAVKKSIANLKEKIQNLETSLAAEEKMREKLEAAKKQATEAEEVKETPIVVEEQQPVVDANALKETMTALAKKKTSKKKTTTTVEKAKTEPVVAEQETQTDVEALKAELASVNEEIAQYEGKNAKAYTKMLAARELGLSESEITDTEVLDYKPQALEELKELKRPLQERKAELEKEIAKLEPAPKAAKTARPPIEEYTLPSLTDNNSPSEEKITQAKPKAVKKPKPRTVDKSIVPVEHPRQKIDPKKKYTNDEKIAILEDKSYRTTVKESEAKRTQEMTDTEYIEYMAASVSLFEDSKLDALVQIKTDEDFNSVLDAIEDGRLTGTEAVSFLTWAETYGYRLQKTTHERISKLLKQKVTESAQNIGIRRWLVDKGYFSGTVRNINNNSDQDFELSQAYVAKYLPELMEKELALKELDQQIRSLENQLEKVTDALEREQLEKERLDKIHKANMIARDDQIGLLNDKIKELESRETEKSKAQEEVAQIINEAAAEMAVFEAEHTIPTPPKSGSVLSPIASEKVAHFLEKLESWRYLALLSNPATWGRNAITNTLVAANAMIEDGLGKLFTKWDRNKVPKYVKQAGYYGDYDESFKALTEEMFGAKINADTKSSKYDTQQFKTDQKEYQEAKRKLRQPKFMTWAQEKEMIVLSDQRWVGPRTMKNLRGMIAGSRDLLLEEAMIILQTKYGVKTETLHELVAHIKETNEDIANLLEDAGNGNLNSLLKLSYELNKNKTKDGRIAVGGLLGDIYNTALYRGNELFFKVDTALSNVISNISKNHKYIGMGIRALVPFVRTTINTGMYMLSHSPAGLVLGVKRLLQNKRSNFNDMRAELSSMLTNEAGSFKKEYDGFVETEKKAWLDAKNKEADFKPTSFNAWLKKTYKEEYDAVFGGSDKNIQKIYEKYLSVGMVLGNSVGLSDVFGRAAAMEKFSQGSIGTAALVLGVILGCLLDIEIDEEDIYGPVMRIGDVKIALDDLSPASTIFTIGTLLTSSKVDEKWNELWQIVVDQSIFGVLDSAIKFNDGFTTFFETAAINYMQQLIPSAVKNITKWIDQGKKDKSGNFFDKAWKTTLSNVPLLSYVVPNKINPYTGASQKYYNTWYGAIAGTLSPFTVRVDKKSDLEKDAIKYGAESTGLSGRFTYNNKEYAVAGRDKENLAKYRANYIQTEYEKIVRGKKLVTVETKEGKRLTTKWDKLDADQKQKVLNNLYSDATNKAKVRYWVVDLGNTYKTSSKTEYQQYKQLFGKNISYDANWTKSKFVER